MGLSCGRATTARGTWSISTPPKPSPACGVPPPLISGLRGRAACCTTVTGYASPPSRVAPPQRSWKSGGYRPTTCTWPVIAARFCTSTAPHGAGRPHQSSTICGESGAPTVRMCLWWATTARFCDGTAVRGSVWPRQVAVRCSMCGARVSATSLRLACRAPCSVSTAWSGVPWPLPDGQTSLRCAVAPSTTCTRLETAGRPITLTASHGARARSGRGRICARWRSVAMARCEWRGGGAP